MKSLLFAAAAVAALIAAAPALAQSTGAYGTVGGEDLNSDSANGGAITGRLGYRFIPYVGVEGDLSAGVGDDHINVAGARTGVHVNDQYAGYAVGFLPVMPNADLLARIGYGATDLNLSKPGHSFHDSVTSWNAGVGGQYFFGAKDGIRADYTRETADRSDLDANVWSLAYVRKF
ncbi:MAG TPA: porin family protein [Caulobacteraceae bacterium]|nr:porin family protein [Caulobacteraceae bacterium]